MDKIYDGEPWIGVNFLPKLKDLSPAQAAYKFAPTVNSVWELLNHIILWREAVLEGFGKDGYSSPEDNFIRPILSPDQKSWEESLNKLQESQTKWSDFLSAYHDADLEKSYGKKPYTNYEVIQGIIQHDIYHLGQIVILVRLLQEDIR